MTIKFNSLLLPRAGGGSNAATESIPGPTETSFTATFGKLLPRAEFLEIDNRKAAYYVIQPTSANVAEHPNRVLFIHGVQTPALGMLPLARSLHTSFPDAEFALIDLWGHGLSSTPLIAHEPSIFHELLDALFDRLKWPSAHLVGYSFGGALTVGYVASRPSRVQSYTLVAPAGLFQSSSLTAEDLNRLRSNDAIEAQKWTLEWLEGGELIVPEDWKEKVSRGEIVAPAVREWQIREHSGHMASVVGILRDGGVMDSDAVFMRAQATGIPNFVVLGALDDICSKEDLGRVGFVGVAVVPEVGHGVVRERFAEVASLIREFWMSLNQASI